MSRYNKRFNRDTFLKKYSKWIDDENIREGRLLEPERVLETLLENNRLSYEERIKVACEIAFIAAYYRATGPALCFKDPAAGWRQIKRAMLYSYWYDRISCRARDFWEVPRGEVKRPFNNVAHMSPCASLALVVARPEAIWYLDLLERSLSDGSLSWIGEDFFAAFLVRLYRKLKREEDIKDIPPNPDDWDNPFGDFFNYWDDEDKLADTIRKMCDYHLFWNYDKSDEHEAEFSNPLSVVNPVEIHALEAVRSELGLSTPTVEHELLQPPFYPIPDFAKNITTEEILAEDDLLRRIVELNQPWCDGLEE